MHKKITHVSNHLSTNKLKVISIDARYTKLERAIAKKLLLKRGEAVTI